MDVAPHLCLESASGLWSIVVEGSAFRLEGGPEAVTLAASFLPLTLRGPDDQMPPLSGSASVAERADGLNLTLQGRAGGATQLYVGPDAIRFSSVIWAAGAPAGLWISARAVLEIENIVGVRVHYYLPPAKGGGKRLTIHSAGAVSHNLDLIRGRRTSFEIRTPFPGRHRLEFSTDSESGGPDTSLRGLALVDIETLSALDGPNPGPATDRSAAQQRLRQNFEHFAHVAMGALAQPKGGAANEAPAKHHLETTRFRRRAAIVCWDLSHNPAGRAHVLYRLMERDWEVELVGPIWGRFGRELWPPLAGEALRHRVFQVSDLDDLWAEAAAYALEHSFEIVVVTKARLPALLIGMLIAEQSRCPLVIDADEHEAAFMRQNGDPDDAIETLLAAPFEAAGTRLAARYLSLADAFTVTSPVLQAGHGAHLVRHARDETLELPTRAQARADLGLDPADFVIAFVGTARTHKGVQQILAALDDLADDRVKLLLAGVVVDRSLSEAIARQPPGRVIDAGPCRFSELGRFVAAADLVPVLQDPTAGIAQSQFPAKLVDALQHGVQVVATPVPPIADLAAGGVVDTIAPDGLADYIRTLWSNPRPASAQSAERRLFENEFSFGVNRARLESALTEAARASNPFSDKFSTALAELRAATRRPVAAPPRRRAAARAGQTYDLAFFWKQNDSTLFGRRSDMLVKYLLQSGRVGRIVHFDQALRTSDLREMAKARSEAHPTTRAMQLLPTLKRSMSLADEPGLFRRLHIDPGAGVRTLAGRPLSAEMSFAHYVRASLEEAGLDPSRTIAWACSVVWGFAELARELQFHRVVVDLIDDQRTWPQSDHHRKRLEKEYAADLRIADLVFTNAEGNRRRFSDLRSDIVLVPNGAEIATPDASEIAPAIRDLRRPIVGYSGNLRDRIDWDLVEDLATARPGWSFPFIGSIDDPTVLARFADLPNVRFLGPLAYEATRASVQHFDVAIMPHKLGAMTESMNPLKLYNYLALGVPSVTTPVANIDELHDLIRMADSPSAFLAAIEAFMQADKPRTSPERLAQFSWSSRVEEILRHLDEIA
jgi:glycosyltransferase involved in cell wall biosynthesis